MGMRVSPRSIGTVLPVRSRAIMSLRPDTITIGMETEVFYQLHLRTPKKFTHNDSSHSSRSSPSFQRRAAGALVVMGAVFASAARLSSRSMLTYLWLVSMLE